MVSLARIGRASDGCRVFMKAKKMRAEPQDGFSQDEELLYLMMQDPSVQLELDRDGVDGDYQGYEEFLDSLEC